MGKSLAGVRGRQISYQVVATTKRIKGAPLPEAINWTTVIISVLSSVATYIIAAAITIAVGWGYMKRTMQEHAATFARHEEWLKDGSIEFKDQAKKDNEILVMLTEIQTTCKGRQRDCDKIGHEHDRFQARLTQAENTIGVMQITITQIQEGLKEFRKQIKTDMHEILQQYMNKE